MGRIESFPSREPAKRSLCKEDKVKRSAVLKEEDLMLVKEAVEKSWLERLLPRQRETIIKRFLEFKTLEQVGFEIGNVSREGVRQAEIRALRNIQKIKEGKAPARGSGHPVEIQINDVVRRYLEEEKSPREIAEELSCSLSTVKNKLELAGVPRRRGRKKTKIDINQAIHYYEKEGLSLTEIAEKEGVSRQVIYRRLKEAGIKIKPRSGRKRKELDLPLLKRLYLDEKKSTIKIAKIMGVCAATISSRLKSAGISLRRRRS